MNSSAPSKSSIGVGAVLVVEDEVPTSQGLKAELVKRGFRAHIAKTAAEAIQCLSDNAYEAVLLDLILPDDADLTGRVAEKGELSRWVGVEILRKIRQGEYAPKGTAPNVPVFVLTCVLDEETRNQLDSLGVEAFWSKPMGLSLVAEHIKLYFRGWRP